MLILPKTYQYIKGESRPEYEKFHGRPKLSYSQYSSYTSKYRPGYYAQYFCKSDRTSNVYSDFGTQAGNVMQNDYSETDLLSKSDLQLVEGFRDERIGYDYEREVVIDRGDYVIQGFIDRLAISSDGIYIEDDKTGGSKKEAEYSPKKYWQTRMYAYAMENETVKPVKHCGVWFMRRQGSHKNPPLSLSGEAFFIDTPYKREEVEKFLSKVDKTAEEISYKYKIFLSLWKS